MYNSVPAEIQFFITCMLAGLVVTFLYDLLRISRRIVNVNDVVINAEDLVFFVVAAVILFYAAYVKNSGEIRWQWFIGGALGVFLYVVIVKNRILNAGVAIYKFLVKIIGVVIKIILFPLKLVLRIFRKPINVVAWYTGQGIKRIKGAARCSRAKAKISLKNISAGLRKK